MPHLTLSQKEKIVTRRCDERSVRRVYQQWKKNGTVETKRSSERPPIFNDRKRRELGRVVRANRRAALKEIRQLISTNACKDTIRKELKKLGYVSRVAVKKSLLSEKKRKARYIFAKNHEHWTVDDWRKVIWTDESSFEISKLSSQPRVWRKILENTTKNAWRQPSEVAELPSWFGAP
ncbi:hypothetical protein RMATCC62417_16591 [Rhizopus microsporus]|nr:hypothetical protein RMATCC62417_16591 [Rhizopus microsporus]